MNTIPSAALALNIPGVMTAASLLQTQSQHHARAVVELTIGTDPAQLLDAAVQQVKTPALREFFQAVVQESEIYQTLTSLTPSSQLHSSQATTCLSKSGESGRVIFPIQTLRRAGELASYWCASGAQERDVLFVATVLRGTQALIAPLVMGDASTADVMFTLVRKALHHLDEQSPRCANLLRLSLDWGNGDEIDDFYVPRLQQAVQKALTQVNLKAMVSATARLPDTRTTRHQPASMAFEVQ